VRRLLMLLAVAVVAAGCGGKQAATIETPSTTPADGLAFSGGAVSPPRVAPPISLHDSAGRPVTLAGQRGRYVLVTFLYVHCPDVCPLIAQNLNAALQQLGPNRTKVRVLAVSVDPKGDTAAAVRKYIRARGLLPQFRYLIGSPQELRRTWIKWNVLSVASSPNVVDHVTYTALIDPTGLERVLYDSKVKGQQVLHDLRLLMRTHA
jgi:protein SCO1/2